MILFVYCIPSPPLHCRTCCGAVSKSKIEWRSRTDCWCPFIAYRDCIQNRQPEIAACIRWRWMVVVEGSPCQVTNLPNPTFCCLVALSSAAEEDGRKRAHNENINRINLQFTNMVHRHTTKIRQRFLPWSVVPARNPVLVFTCFTVHVEACAGRQAASDRLSLVPRSHCSPFYVHSSSLRRLLFAATVPNWIGAGL